MKRIFDLTISTAALVLLSPVLLTLVFVVLTKLGKPVFFVQERPGFNGKAFRIIKFRTMRDAKGPDGRPLPDDRRLTRVGRFLRATSLDELPQLWNVVRGDLSLVGPRPLLMEYLQLYSAEQARRHEMRPGITGWAQINGRNTISWEEKFELDVWYVDNQTLRLDIKIIWLTMMRVARRDGISAAGEATVPNFTGREA